MFLKFWTIPEICAVEFLLQKQVHTGSLQNSCCEQLFEKLLSVKMDSIIDVLLGSCQKYSEWLFFWNGNGRLPSKIQTSICLEHQWMALNGWVAYCREISSCIKWYWCQITKQKKEYWGALDVDVLFFSTEKKLEEENEIFAMSMPLLMLCW